MSLNVTQSNQNLTLHVSQSNVKATLSVTQNVNELHITAIQNNEVTKLQPIFNTVSTDYIETDPIFQASEASLFVTGDKDKLDGIEAGAEVNVQSDWNQINPLDDSYIKNKPTIPTVLTNHSELNLDDGTNPHGTTKNDVGLGNVPNLDTTDAVNNSHTHTNKSILDLITEPFTTSLKSLYDSAVTNINNLLLTGERLITSSEITKLNNTSGTNSGDETTLSIQTKRPLKSIEGQSLEGTGNIDLTKNDVGLNNVDNTSDLNKPISTATQTALDLKENTSNKATNLISPDNTKYPTTLAVSTALDGKQNVLTNPITGTGTTNYIPKFTGSGTLGNSQIFDNGTNVGIGTTSPSVKLDVAGQARFASQVFPVIDIYRDTTTKGGGIYGGAKLERLMTGGTAQAGSGIGFYFKSPNNVGNSTFAGIFGGGLYDVSNGAEKGEVVIGASWQGADPVNNRHLVVQATSATNANVLIPSGNVGIGTTSPQARLDIRAQGATSTDIVLRIRNSTDTTNLFQFTGVGNLLLANNTFIGFRNAANNADAPIIQLTNTNQLNLGTNSSSTPAAIGLWTNSTERVRILNNGNVNVGSFTNVESALLVLNSTSKGFLPPRMTTVERNAIISPAAGLIVYDTTDNKHYGFNGTIWNALY